MKKLITLFAACAALTAPAGDITSYLTGTQLDASTTNATAGTGIWGWNIDQVAVLQASIISTNGVAAAATNTISFLFDTSANGTDWSLNAYSYTLVSNGTNAVTGISRITNTVGGKWLRFGSTRNPNTNYITVSRFSFDVQ